MSDQTPPASHSHLQLRSRPLGHGSRNHQRPHWPSQMLGSGSCRTHSMGTWPSNDQQLHTFDSVSERCEPRAARGYGTVSLCTFLWHSFHDPLWAKNLDSCASPGGGFEPQGMWSLHHAFPEFLAETLPVHFQKHKLSWHPNLPALLRPQWSRSPSRGQNPQWRCDRHDHDFLHDRVPWPQNGEHHRPWSCLNSSLTGILRKTCYPAVWKTSQQVCIEDLPHAPAKFASYHQQAASTDVTGHMLELPQALSHAWGVLQN